MTQYQGRAKIREKQNKTKYEQSLKNEEKDYKGQKIQMNMTSDPYKCVSVYTRTQ